MRKKLLTKFLSVAMSVALIAQPATAFAADSSYKMNERITAADSTTEKGITTFAGDSISDATSISLGTTYNGSITETNEKDYYKFTLNSSGKVTLSASVAMTDVSYGIYDDSGNELWVRSPSWNSTTELISTNEDIDLTKGTYYFSIGEHYNSTGNYSFKLNFSSANESFTEAENGSDNSLNTANNVSLNTSYNGQLAINDEKDFYKFNLSTSGRITISATAKMMYIHYYIYDSSGNELWGIGPSWNSTTEVISTNEVVDLTKGTYYFVAAQYYDTTGNYSFKLNFSSANESFAETGNGIDNSLNTANSISLNSTYKGQLAINDEKDFYKFSLPTSGRITISATAKIGYIHYYIYDSSGNELWGSNGSWNSTTEETLVSEKVDLNKGNYYFSVQQYYSCTGPYSFKLSTHTHKYEDVITKATPTSNGKIVKKCSCGVTNGTSTIYAPKTIALSSTSYAYDGKMKKPTVTVKDSKGKTISSSKYKVTYSSGRKNVGKYTVKVTFKSKYYSGSMSKTFTIKPKATSISKLTAKSKAFTAKWKKQTSQVSGYQIQYSTSKGFSSKTTKNITKNSTTSATYKKLKAKKKYYVRIRTYKKVSGTTYYSSWSSVKSVTTKK